MFGKKRSILAVIKYGGSGNELVWKYPREDFNTKSQLIVKDHQEAIFFRDGQALDTFPTGRYTLETQNIPLLRNIVGLSTGGVSPFHCEVYFVNKIDLRGLPWGTNSPIRLDDAEKHVPIEVTAYGDFSLYVQDGRKLINKLAGAVRSYTQENIKDHFSQKMEACIRNCIADTMETVGGLRINSQLISLAEKIQKSLSDVFSEYGIELKDFTVGAVNVFGLEEYGRTKKEVDLDIMREKGKAVREKIKIDVDAARIQEEGKAKNAVLLEKGMAEAQVDQAKGITEVQRQTLSVAKALAENPGPNTTVMGNGMPFYGSAAGTVQSPAGMASEIVKTAVNPPAAKETGGAGSDWKARLKEIKEGFEEGLLTEAEYQEKRKEVMKCL